MLSTRLFLIATLAGAVPAAAQTVQVASAKGADTAVTDSIPAKPIAKPMRIAAPPIEIQHMRAPDQRGLNVFESPKEETVPFEGFKLNWGGAFTQQYQNLTHQNTAAPKLVNGTDQNKLIPIGQGFNNAVANLYLNVQLARGIRVALESYLSARHHQESWVKDGYFLIDGSPIDNALLDQIMKYTTLKVGHFEINYGDAHYRRSDNGQAIYNPFVGNYIIDDFTTEIGAEAYLRANGYMAMAGITGGEVRGQITAPGKRGPSYLAKLGFDKKPTENLRVRLTGSMYKTDRSVNNTLTSGDRAGSRYYDVLENTASTEKDNAWSGAIQSKMGNMVTAFVVNPFIKYRGVEFFGNAETMTGAGAAELQRRTLRQYAGDLLYRFANDQLYVGGRYNTVSGRLPGIANDISVDRTQLGGGWYVTPNVLAKMEYVNQTYNDFPTTDIRSGGKFKGVMIEGVVAF
ncbi:MAG TPA: porin [Gemmatimonadaceae bacterium]|nr:porin [Gemmatimonadaceae bacterium]